MAKRRRLDDEGLDPKKCEVAHMIQFFLCQMRWQYGKIVGDSYDEFDAEALSIDPENGAADLASCSALMDAFFRGPARGDRWVPWHTVTCDQERYLMEKVRVLDLPEDEKVAWCFAFSASRCCDMWDCVILPYVTRGAIADPEACFGLDSPFCERLRAWRKQGNKLHTSAFNPYPPRGSGGEKFVDFIALRHVFFAKIGYAAFPFLKEGVTMDALDTLFRGFNRIGPTMSKVLLVTTHLWYPHLGVLDDGCEVGDGADQAFDFLYPKAERGDRRALLANLHSYLNSADGLDPRFHHMINWLAQRTRRKFEGVVPDNAIEDRLSIYDLQVQLCEWRKFRKNVDRKRTICRGLVLPTTSDDTTTTA